MSSIPELDSLEKKPFTNSNTVEEQNKIFLTMVKDQAQIIPIGKTITDSVQSPLKVRRINKHMLKEGWGTELKTL